MKALRVSPQVDPEVDSAKQENKLLVAGLLAIKKAGGGGYPLWQLNKKQSITGWERGHKNRTKVNKCHKGVLSNMYTMQLWLEQFYLSQTG